MADERERRRPRTHSNRLAARLRVDLFEDAEEWELSSAEPDLAEDHDRNAHVRATIENFDPSQWVLPDQDGAHG